MADRVVRVTLSGDASSLIRAANSAATALGRVGNSGAASARGVANSSSASARAVASSAQRMQGSSRDIGSSFQSMGSSASAGFGKIAGLAAGGFAVVGGLSALTSAFKSTIKVGMDFQSTINNLGAVTGSSAAQLAQVSAKARALGNDLDLPAASASDAAQAMLELSKGGLTVKQSMDAAKGTLTLAAAAQISGADAATIQAAALNTFGLSADKAAHVADVLANTANAAAGDITDFAQGLAQSGSVAAGFGISIDDTATVLGLFAKNGIIGSDAGTSFKTMLTQLAAPTKQAQQAMEVLGLSVYDAGGKFVGTKSLTDQLAKAQHKLTQEQFNLNATTVFGTDALRGANILAKEGDAGYTSLAKSVSKAGGAQQVAAAQTKGLSGAFGLVKNAVQDVQLNAFDKIAPGLEKAVRGVATAIPGIADVILPVFGHIVDQATQFAGQLGDVFKGFGPDNISAILTGAASIGSAVTNAFQNAFTPEVLHIVGNFAGSVLKDLISLGTSITDSAGKFFAPIVAGAASLIQTAQPYVERFIGIVKGTVKEITPLGKTIGDLFKTLSTNGTLDTLGNFFTGLGSAIKGFVSGAVPAIGGVVRAFGAMGPVVDTAAVAVGGLLLFRGPLLGFFGQIQARAAAAAVSLAATSGALRFGTNSVAGAAGAAAGGLSRVAGVLGGPWGLAIGAGVAALFTWINRSNEAATKTRDFSTAIDVNTGKLGENASVDIASQVKDSIAAYKAAGGATGDYTSAIQGNTDAQKRVIATYTAAEQKAISGSVAFTKYGKAMAELGITTQDVATAYASGDDAIGALQTKIRGGSDVLNKYGIGIQDVNNIVQQFGSVTSDSGKSLDQYHKDLADMSTQLKTAALVADDAAKSNTSVGSSAAGAAGGITTMASAQERYLASLNGQATQGQAEALANQAKAVADVAGAYKAVGAAAPDAAAQSTAVSDALKAVSDNATLADQNAQFFLLTMQQIGGKDISAQQALDANAASLRGVGAAYRDVTQNLIDQRKAAEDLKKAKDNLGKTEAVKDDKGNVTGYKTASDATTQDDITAAQLKLAAANAQVASSQAGINDAQAKAQQTTSTLVSSILQQEIATKGIAAATKDAKTALSEQRAEFVKQISTQGGSVAATAASIASANKLADAYGLVPKTVDTVISGDPRLAVLAAGVAKKAAEEATKTRTTKFNAATKDALGDIGLYGQTVAKFPKGVKTKFDADVAVAEANGQRLYRVYNKTTGKWEAKFETPGAAASQVVAGNLVQQYDKAKGTWTADLTARDLATGVVKGVQQAIDAITGKTVEVNVVAKGSSYIQPSTGNEIVAGFGHSAAGGQISGPGTGTSDSIPTMLSDGEFVVKAVQTAKYLPLLHAINAGTKGFAAGGVVGKLPASAVNFVGSGNASGATDSISSFYGVIDGAVKSANAAAKAAADAAAAAAAAIPAASSAGVEQWRALATKVALAHGENINSVQVMLNQMARESSGNPAAINLTDINAQNGHPSVGLLQFIPSTFAAHADPGFSSNIYDPESQMRAWYNYINANYGGYVEFAKRGYGAYAAGGRVSGKGTGTSDSNLALVSDGEFIVNANSTAKNLPLLQAINKYATGGLVGTLTSLSGQTRAAAGPELSQVVQALQDIASAVADARAAANDKQSAAVAARDNLVGAQGKQQQNLIDYTAKLTEAQHILASETSKTSARTKALDKQRVTDAEAALAKVKAADKASVGKASREYSSALRTAQSYANVATQAERFQKTQQRAYQVQSAYAARVDYFTTKLGAATDKLSTMRADRASLASGIASTVSGFDGGITGHPDTRNTFATILRGQQYDQDQAQKFNLNISKLSKLGLNNASLNQIASAGVDGGGVTAAALAGASKAQIAQLNGVTSKITSIGNNVGNVVAGQFYDAGIQAATGLVKGLQSQIGAIQKVMNGIAQSVVDTLTSKLKIHSPSRVMHELGTFIPQGLANGIAADTSVSKAVGNMMAIPAGVNMAAVRSAPRTSGPAAPVVQLSINTADPLVMAVAKMMDLRIDGVLIDLEQSFDKVGSQR